jgi:hypothetical protein
MGMMTRAAQLGHRRNSFYSIWSISSDNSRRWTVNPLTVVEVSQGVTRLFRIETGKRRHWSTWLLVTSFLNTRGRDAPLHRNPFATLIDLSASEGKYSCFLKLKTRLTSAERDTGPSR